MAKLSNDVKDVLNKQKPLPIATADKSGKPNVIFVGMWKIIDDETIMIVDNYFKVTAANIKANPHMAIVAYDSETKQSYQVKGRADYLDKGPQFEEAKAIAESKKFPGKAAVILHVEEVYTQFYGPDAGKRIA